MNLTFRQIVAYLEFGETVDRKNRADDLRIAALGAQGDGTSIEKAIKELGG